MDVLVVFGAYRGENSRGHQPNASIALVDTLWDDAGTGAVPLPSWLVAQTATVCFRAMSCRKLAGLDGEPAGWCVLARTRALVGRASLRACELQRRIDLVYTRAVHSWKRQETRLQTPGLSTLAREIQSAYTHV